MEQESLARRLVRLFTGTLMISTFTFGGGFVIVPLLKKEFCDKHGYLGEDEMLNLSAIAQTSPGPIAVNCAVLVGQRTAGIPGIFAAGLGCVIPPLVILTVISMFYDAFSTQPVIAAILEGMRAGVAAVIADVVWQMGGKVVRSHDLVSVAVMAAAFAAVYFLKLNVLWVILAAAAVGIVQAIVRRRKGASA